MTAADLFTPLRIRDVELRNRIVVSPMCQYSCGPGTTETTAHPVEGALGDWHLVHLGSRAVGGAGLIFVEATAVEARGRISPGDAGLWTDAQVEPLARVARFVRAHGAALGVQLAHAGRKASTKLPWLGHSPLPPGEGGWPVVGPSPIPFAPEWAVPHELTREEIRGIQDAFVAAAKRAAAAGVQVLEVHGAHGYLGHSFVSPLSNKRTDEYGGSLVNRARFLVETTRSVRAVWTGPLFVRVSATDWLEGGTNVEETVQLARWLKEAGADAIDCSSGGAHPSQKIQVGPGYQVPFSERIRRESEVLTTAVGMITEPAQADALVREGKADLVALAREELRDPYWPQRAAKVLGFKPQVPVQYARAH